MAEIVVDRLHGDELSIWVPHMDFDEPLSVFVDETEGEWCGPIALPPDTEADAPLAELPLLDSQDSQGAECRD